MTVPSQPSRSGPDVPSAADGTPAPFPVVTGVAGVPQAVTAGEPATQVIGTAAVAQSAAPAVAVPTAVPSPVPPGAPPAVGTVGSDGPGPPLRWHARRHRGLPRLVIGRHAAPAGALEQLQVRRESFGLRIGRARSGEPVIVRLFRPAPTRVTLVGGVWAAALLTFRALRFGSRAVVFAPAAAGWIELGRRATGRTDRVAVRAPGEELTTPASADVPVLRVDITGQASAVDLPDWTTRLATVPVGGVSARAGELTASDLVLVERLPPSDVAVLAPVLGLPPQTQRDLLALPDGALAVLSRAGAWYAWTEPTTAEQEAVVRD